MSDDFFANFGYSDQQIDDELSKVYKDAPSIQHYVQLRRKNLNKEIEVAISGGLDWLFANEKILNKYGIEPALFAKTLDADPMAISELCLQLLDLIIEREDAESSGETHVVGRGKAISNSMINYFVNTMLDALSWNDVLYIPRDLIVLIRHQLGGYANNAIAKRQKSKELRSHAYYVGARLLEQGIKPSIRKVATILNVNASTISRMYPGDSLLNESTSFLESMKSVQNSETPFANLAKKYADKNQTK